MPFYVLRPKHFLSRAFISNRSHHPLISDTPFLNLLLESSSPSFLSLPQELSMPLSTKHILARARFRTTERAFEGLDQSIMDDPQLLLNRVPIRLGPRLDRKVPIVYVRDSDDLRPVIQVQIRLFGLCPMEVRRLDFGEHIGKDLGVGFENHDAGVETEREPSVVQVHVRRRREDEREFEEFVKVFSDVGVRVEIDGGLDADRVERPDPQLGILVDESGPNAISVVGWLYEVDRMQFPAHFSEVT